MEDPTKAIIASNLQQLHNEEDQLTAEFDAVTVQQQQRSEHLVLVAKMIEYFEHLQYVAGGPPVPVEASSSGSLGLGGEPQITATVAASNDWIDPADGDIA